MRILRRTRVLLVTCVLVVSCTRSGDPLDASTATTARSAPPTGSEALEEGRIVFDSDRTGTFEIHTMAPDGSGVVQLTDDPQTDAWWGRLSPDRRRILFYRTPAGVHDRDYGATSLWMMAADGGDETELRPAGHDGWATQGHAEWSPDGTSLVMFGGPQKVSPQIHVTDIDGQEARVLTDRGGQNLDPSFGPDGRTIVFVACPGRICFPSDYEIYRMPLDGSSDPERLTFDDLRDHDPYVSPDGTQVAWLTQTTTDGPVGTWNIRVADIDGGDHTWVTNDDGINSRPEWTRDGSRILFHRFDPELGGGFQIYSIAPDGSDRRAITEGHPGVNEYPSN